jgi:hypothetical protein
MRGLPPDDRLLIVVTSMEDKRAIRPIHSARQRSGTWSALFEESPAWPGRGEPRPVECFRKNQQAHDEARPLVVTTSVV